MKTLYLILICLFSFAFAFAQEEKTISSAEEAVFRNVALTRVETYGASVTLLGQPDINNTKKKIVIKELMEDFIENGKVVFYNDLDPTSSTSDNFRVDNYLRNVYLFYPENVKYELHDIESSEVYYDPDKNIYFVKVMAMRHLEGMYNNKGIRTKAGGSKKLDFYVKVYENNDHTDIKIFGMAEHNDNLNSFHQVKIVQGGKSLLVPVEQMEELEKKLEGERKKLEDAQREAENHKKRSHELDSKNKSLSEQKQELEIEIRDLAGKKNELNSEVSSLQQKVEQLSLLARQNRTSIQLGGQLAFALGENYHDQTDNEEGDETKFALSGLSFLGAVNIRLGKLDKFSNPKAGTSLSFIFNIGNRDGYTTRGIFNELQTDMNVDSLRNSTFWEMEAGIVISQNVRLTAGYGKTNLYSYNDALSESVKSNESYYLSTIGVISPKIGNTTVVGLDFTLVGVDNRERINDGEINIHPRLSLRLAFQIQ